MILEISQCLSVISRLLSCIMQYEKRENKPWKDCDRLVAIKSELHKSQNGHYFEVLPAVVIQPEFQTTSNRFYLLKGSKNDSK